MFLIVATLSSALGMVLINSQGVDDIVEKSKAKAECEALHSAAGIYKLENGDYPIWLFELMHNERGKKYLSGYSDVPKDPWGNDYIYEMIDREAGEYRIISYGADGRPGGEGDARDRSHPAR